MKEATQAGDQIVPRFSSGRSLPRLGRRTQPVRRSILLSPHHKL